MPPGPLRETCTTSSRSPIGGTTRRGRGLWLRRGPRFLRPTINQDLKAHTCPSFSAWGPVAGYTGIETNFRESQMSSDLRRHGIHVNKAVLGQYDSAFPVTRRPRHEALRTGDCGVSAGNLVRRDREVRADLDVVDVG